MLKNVLTKIFGTSSALKPSNFNQAVDYVKRYKVSCRLELNSENYPELTITGGNFFNSEETFTSELSYNIYQLKDFYENIKKVNQFIFLEEKLNTKFLKLK